MNGSAAEWIGEVPESVTLAPGKTGWVGLHVHVPEDASPGTYSLEATLRSTTFPEVSASFRGTYTVGKPTAGN